jgi:hypothetical protein
MYVETSIQQQPELSEDRQWWSEAVQQVQDVSKQTA